MTLTRQLTVASLFAGVGGFDIAAERAGMEVLWQSEYDKFASQVLELHWPGLNLGDIHGIDRDRLIRFGGERAASPDILCGGFPCQDYSVAGNRDGLVGDRGALWWEYLRLIDELRPTWVFGENVPGLLSSRGGADFETIIGSLTERGYGVAWAILDARYFGVAQRRRRLFIVGHSGGVPRPEVLALAEGMFGYPEPSREAQEDSAPDAEAGFGGGGVSRWQTDGDYASTLETRPAADRLRHEPGHIVYVSEIAPALTARDFRSPRDDIAEPALVAYEMFEDNRRTGPRIHDGVSPTLQARMGTGGNNSPMVMEVYALRDGHIQNSNGEPYSDEGVSYTLTAHDKHGVVVAFSAKDYGQDAAEELAPTLRAMGHDKSHPNGGGQIAIAFNARQDPVSSEEMSPPLDTKSPHGVVAEVFQQNQRDEVRIMGDQAGALVANAGAKSGQNYVRIGTIVRKLTPLECNRLQGFNDNFNRYGVKDHPKHGKMLVEISDSQRYKQMGNAVAVPVVEWIMRNIAEAEARDAGG